MNDLEDRLRADFQQATAGVEDTIDPEAALFAGQQARSSRRIGATVGITAMVAVAGLVGWTVLQVVPIHGGVPAPMQTVSAVPSVPATPSTPYKPTDPMSATFDLGGTINGQVPTYDSVGVSVRTSGDQVDVTVSLNKASKSIIRHFTFTSGKPWYVPLDKHLVVGIVPGRPTWLQGQADAVKGSLTDQQPLTGINATAFLTGFIKAGGPDTVRGFLWRATDGVVHDTLGNIVPSAEVALKEDTYLIYRDVALDVIGIVPQKDGGGYSFRVSADNVNDLVKGGMGTRSTGGKWSWTQFGSLPPGAHDIKLVVAGPGGEWGSAILADGWVVVVAHATTKTTNVITSITYTDAAGKVFTNHG